MRAATRVLTAGHDDAAIAEERRHALQRADARALRQRSGAHALREQHGVKHRVYGNHAHAERRRVPPPRQQRDQGPARAHDVEPREELVVSERQAHVAGDDELERERHGWARAGACKPQPAAAAA